MAPSLRQLLVHLDATQALPDRLAVALKIAKQHGAALAAL